MRMFNDSLYTQRISLMTYSTFILAGITMFKHIDPKFWLPHRCQSMRLMNKTPLQYTKATGSKNVVCHIPINSPELQIERSPLILVC